MLALPALALAQDQHAAIQSTRGVQHKAPLISDDFVVGCIMIMFLLLFAFGARAPKIKEIPDAHHFTDCLFSSRSQASNDDH